MIRLELENDLAQQIADMAQTARPAECCGLLEGFWTGDTARAVDLHTARNLSADADKFEISPEDHLAAQKAARANGHVLIGCYHSHPGSAPAPSAADRAGATEENFLWLIAGGTPGGWDLAAFAFQGGDFAPAYLVMSSE